MKKKLTAAALANNSLDAGEYWDTGQPGLHLRVGVNRKTWLYRYRLGGSQKLDRVGYFPQMGLAEARAAAAELSKRLDAGVPIVAETPAHPQSPNVLTLGKLIDRYEALRLKEGHKVKSLAEAMRTVRRGLADYLPGNSHMGNRLLGYFGPVWKWAVQEDYADTNFVRDIRKAPEAKRERTLDRRELRSIWHASFDLGNSIPTSKFGRMIRFLICTAQRVGEAQAMRGGDLLGDIWKQADNKSNRPHRLKLAKLALEQIGTTTDAKALVFPGEAGTKIGAISKLRATLDEAAGVSDWRVYDLRRTAASLMQEIGVPENAIRATLNHAIPGVGGVYHRGELDKQKAEALQTWNDELGKIISRKRAVTEQRGFRQAVAFAQSRMGLAQCGGCRPLRYVA